MPQTERLYRLKSLLDAGRTLRRDELLRTLEVSAATLKRDIEFLRDRLGAPIVYDRSDGGWRLDNATGPGRGLRELPGLWMTEEEITALMAMHCLISDLDSGELLAPRLQSLLTRLERLLDAGSEAPAELRRRIRLVPMASRRVAPDCFQAIGSALLRRRRVVLMYYSRSRNETTKREVSPQRLVRYRDNWYLDGWCHQREALRTFSLDAIVSVEPGNGHAHYIADEELDLALAAGYGIFAGAPVEWAVLRFSRERARWVAGERWHPAQEGHYEPDGRWTLRVPFSDPRELAMDVLRHIPEVQVLEPASLARLVEAQIREAARRLP